MAASMYHLLDMCWERDPSIITIARCGWRWRVGEGVWSEGGWVEEGRVGRGGVEGGCV